MKLAKVYVVTGDSESGDHYGPVVFSKNPSKKVLSKLANGWDGADDLGPGPGYGGSYVHLNVKLVTIDEKLI